MRLRFGGARPDGAPRDQVRDVLRGEQVEELGPARQPHAVDVEQQLPREAQALVDREAAVEPRVVDEALPADGRARLLEVHAHHDGEIGAQPARRRREQSPRTRAPRPQSWIEHGPDDGDQPVVGAVQHAMHRLPRARTVARQAASTGSSRRAAAARCSARTAAIRRSSVRRLTVTGIRRVASMPRSARIMSSLHPRFLRRHAALAHRTRRSVSSSFTVSSQPRQASVIGHAVVERLAGHEVLPPRIEVALDHHAHDAALARGDLAAPRRRPPPAASGTACEELACEKSTIRRCASPAAASSWHAASTLAAS